MSIFHKKKTIVMFGFSLFFLSVISPINILTVGVKDISNLCFHQGQIQGITPNSSHQNSLCCNPLNNSDGIKTKWAILIACSGGVTYERHERRDRNEIRALQQILVKNGWDKDYIFILLEEEAITEAILNSSFDWLTEKGEDEDDLIIFYFSGHGYYHTLDQPPLDEPDGRDEIFHPWDPDMNGWNPDVFIVDDVLATKFDSLKSRNIVIFMHTCHAGGWIDGSNDLCDSGRVVLTSCDVDEASWIMKIRIYWLFSFYIIRGLNGHADTDRNGLISAEELFRYTEVPVMYRSTLLGYLDSRTHIQTQHPQIFDGWPSEKNNTEELSLIQLGG